MIDGTSVQWEEPSSMEGADWLARNLVPQYWRGEKVEIDTGRYRACHLNNDWYVNYFNPLPMQSRV